MKVEEWKEGLSKTCDKVIEAYTEFFTHIMSIDKIDGIGDIDEDELKAFMIVKTEKLEKEAMAIADKILGI